MELDFKDFFERENMGLNQPQNVGPWSIAKGVGRVMAKQIPGVGLAVDVGEEAQKLWQQYKAGRDIKPLLMKMMSVQDNMRQGGKNVFDLDDNLDQLMSQKSKEMVANNIIAKLQKITDPSKIPDETANIVAMQYITNTIKPYYNKYVRR